MFGIRLNMCLRLRKTSFQLIQHTILSLKPIFPHKNLFQWQILFHLTKCTLLIWYSQDRAISKDPCEAVKQITTGFKKWSDRFMADCGSHQKNPQIPKKMDKFKDKMISHLQTQAGYNTFLAGFEIPNRNCW